jgi:hypothetical protein
VTPDERRINPTAGSSVILRRWHGSATCYSIATRLPHFHELKYCASQTLLLEGSEGMGFEPTIGVDPL